MQQSKKLRQCFINKKNREVNKKTDKNEHKQQRCTHGSRL